MIHPLQRGNVLLVPVLELAAQNRANLNPMADAVFGS